MIFCADSLKIAHPCFLSSQPLICNCYTAQYSSL